MVNIALSYLMHYIKKKLLVHAVALLNYFSEG
jgi:hypothetical protein